ncbi:Ig-like domain-containing protein [Blastopirellula marina]|uniref:Calx-beta domain-containing protein n=1 Tax=Blastopirellula marina TaxID=124 RepID=A0A2S8GQE1_9BACT|nr:Ig-like domain-containing protein [Blastopirellula marina]PQO46656.1 hypothetical protein C5Y93_07425 [Blastopirellula marina]
MRLPIRSWNTTLAKLGLRWAAKKQKRPLQNVRYSALEMLEDRQMWAVDLVSQETNDDIYTAQFGSLSEGTEFVIEGAIGNGSYTYDVDFYEISLTAGQTLEADVDAYQTDDDGQLSSLNGYLRLFDEYGYEVASNDDGFDPDTSISSQDSLLTYTAGTSGTYYLAISENTNTTYDPEYGGSNSGYGGYGGAYQIQLNLAGASSGGGSGSGSGASDVPGDTLATAQSVSLAANVQTTIEEEIGNGSYGNKDVDFYAVTLSAGQTISIDIDACYDDNYGYMEPLSYLDSYLRVFSASGTQLTSNNEGSSANDYFWTYGDAYVSFTAPSAGTYYIGVSSAYNTNYDPTVGGSGSSGSSSYDGTGAYRLQLIADGPSLMIGDMTVDETAGTVTFTVTLDPTADEPVTVDYTTINGTATAGSDYAATSGTLTFPIGTATQTITVPILDDSFIENPESFTIQLSNAVGASIGDATAIGTIHSEDVPPSDLPGDTLETAQSVSLSANVQTTIEEEIGNGSYGAKDVDFYAVTLSAGQTISIDIDARYDDTYGYMEPLSYLDSYLRVFSASGAQLTANNDGSSANDYFWTYGDAYVSFTAPAAGTYYIGVSAASNTYYDPTAGGTGTTGSSYDGSGAYRLQLIASGPSLTIGDMTVDETAGTVTFTVTLDPTADETVTVDFTTIDGTATAGSDYVATSGTLTFPVGTATRTITVPILDDSFVENSESFTIQLSNAVGASIGDATAIGTIHSEDVPPSDLPGDTLATALGVSLSANVQTTIAEEIGNGSYGAKDVDFYAVTLSAGQTISIDIDARYDDDYGYMQPLSGLDSYLRVFNASGTQLTANDDGTSANDYYWTYGDAYVSFTAPSAGTYYIGVSSVYNTNYNPAVGGSGSSGSSYDGSGAYELGITLEDANGSSGSGSSSGSSSGSGGTAEISVSEGSTNVVDGGPAIDFGSVYLGNSIEKTFTIYNEGDAPLTLDVASLVLPAGFSVVQAFDTTVAPYDYTTWIVRFAGVEAKSYSGEITFATNDPDDGETEFSISVSGQVLEPSSAGSGNAIAIDDSYSIGHGKTLNVYGSGVLVNDSDPDQDPLAAVLLQTTQHGSLSLSTNGSFVYTPEAGYVGSDWFAYAADDGSGLSAAAIVQIDVTNIVPSLADDSFSVAHDKSLSYGNVLWNDSDEDNGDVLTVAWHSDAKHGTVSLASSGELSYTPDAGYVGEDAFTYRISDGTSQSRVGVVRISVTNTAPSGTSDSFVVIHDKSLNGSYFQNVLSNDVSGDADSLSVSWHSEPLHGTLSLSDDGYVSYQPAAGFVGDDVFYYRVTDGTEEGLPTSVTIHVTNVSPTASDRSYSVHAGGALQVNGTGIVGSTTDGDGDAVSVAWHSEPQHGALSLQANGTFLYTPDEDYVGVDGFAFTLSDGISESAVKIVSLNVTNATPVAADRSFSVQQGTAWTLAAQQGLLAYSTDGNNDPLSIASSKSTSHGSLTVNADGSLAYTPDPGFIGQDSFTYAVKDDWSESSVATVVFNVTNAAPVANNDSYSVKHTGTLQGNVLSNDSDYNYSDQLSISDDGSWYSDPLHGTLSISADGTFTYVPDTGFVGVDRFVYRMTDGASESNVATVTINVTNSLPTVQDKTYSVGWEYAGENAGKAAALTGDLLSSDNDSDGDPLTVVLVQGTQFGELTFDGNGEFTYQANAGFVGTDSILFYTTDGIEESPVQRAVIAVTASQPYAAFDAYSVGRGMQLKVTTLGGSTNPEDKLRQIEGSILSNDAQYGGAAAQTLQITRQPEHGTVTLEQDNEGNFTGGFIYTPSDFSSPNPEGSGVDSFSYQFGFDPIKSNAGTVRIAIDYKAPVANDDQYSFSQYSFLNDEFVQVSAENGLLKNDASLWGYSGFGDYSAFKLVAQDQTGVETAHGGFVDILANGSFIYTPPVLSATSALFSEPDSFVYTLKDGISEDTAIAYVAWDNYQPIARPDYYEVNATYDLTVSVSDGLINAAYRPGEGDYDPDGEEISIFQPENIEISGGHQLEVNADGSFYFKPNPTFGNDAVTFTYRVTDGVKVSEPTTATIWVANTSPTAKNYWVSMSKGSGSYSFVLPFSDDSQNSLINITTSGPLPPGAEINHNNTVGLMYIPEQDTAGTYVIDYSVTDQVEGSLTRTATVYVYVSDPNCTDCLTYDSSPHLQPTYGVSYGQQVSLGMSAQGEPPTVSSYSPVPGGVFTPQVDANGKITAYATYDPDGSSLPATGSVEKTGSYTAEYQRWVEGGSGDGASGGHFETDYKYESIHVELIPNRPVRATGVSFTAYAITPDAIDYFANPTTPYITSYEASGNVTAQYQPWGPYASDSPVTAQLVDGPSYMLNFVLNPDGSFTYKTTTPNLGLIRRDQFSFKLIQDGKESAVVYAEIEFPTLGMALPKDDNYDVLHDRPFVVPWSEGVLLNDQDVSTERTIILLDHSPTKGTVTMDAGGGFVYTPYEGEIGSDSFTYRIVDGSYTSPVGTVHLNITNSPGTARNDTYTIEHDQTLIVTTEEGVLSKDPFYLSYYSNFAEADADADDGDIDRAKTTIVAQPENGTVAMSEYGSFKYTPNPGFVGTDVFYYKFNDGAGATEAGGDAEIGDSNVAAVTIRVTNTQQHTVADVYSISHGAIDLRTTIDDGVRTNDPSDAESDLAAAVLLTTSGGLSLLESGGFSFTKPDDFVGRQIFAYVMDDGVRRSEAAAITIDVTNAAPTAGDDTYATERNVPLLIGTPDGVLSNDSDADEDRLTWSVVAQPKHGTLVPHAGGSFKYVPAQDFVGNDAFVYEIDDQLGGKAIGVVTISVSSNAPIAGSYDYSVERDSSLTVSRWDGLQSDGNSDDLTDQITVVVETPPTHGSVVLEESGFFRCVPDAGFVGVDAFTYRVANGTQQGGIGTVRITVTDVAAPTVQNDSYSVVHDQTLAISQWEGLLANDEFSSAADFEIVQIAGPRHGSLTINAAGSFVYQPDAGFVGTDVFTYMISVDGRSSGVATASIDVTNSAPSATADSYEVGHDQTLWGSVWNGVLSNDGDGEDDLTIAELLGGASNGAVSLNSNGSFQYVPNSGFVGSDRFVYRVVDETGQYSLGEVTIEVSDSAPTAVDDSYSVLYQSDERVLHVSSLPWSVDYANVDLLNESGLIIPQAGGLLSNDSDADFDSMTIELVNAPASGSLTLTDRGAFRYLPDAGFAGLDGFTYQVTDGLGKSRIAFAAIDVRRRDPQATADSYNVFTLDTLAVAAPQGVLANDSDADGDQLSAELFTEPQHGVLHWSATGAFSYTPDDGFVGVDSFTYRLLDDGGEGAVTRVTLNVVGTPSIDVAPVAENDSFTVAHRDILEVPSGGLIANDVSSSGRPLTAELETDVLHGQLVLLPSGAFRYVPDDGFTGSDSFTYRVSDGLSSSDPATVTISVTNQAAAAEDDSYEIHFGAELQISASEGVLANDEDAEGDQFSATIAAGPANGTVQLHESGSFRYAPNPGFVGTDSFTYSVTGGSTATVTISVTNTAPTATGETYSVTHDTSLSVAANEGLLSNDTDADDDILTFSLLTGPSHGTLTSFSSGAFVYSPSPGYKGSDSFAYRTFDGVAWSEPATASISVTNYAPTTQTQYYGVAHDRLLVVSAEDGLLSSPTDSDEDDLSIAVNTDPTHGSLELLGNGAFIYQPNEGYVGQDSFTVRISDGVDGNGDAVADYVVQTVALSVTNSVPNLPNKSYSVQHGQDLIVSQDDGLIGEAADADGDPWQLTVVDGPAHGDLTVGQNGEFVYASNDPNFVGQDVFTVWITDGIDNQGDGEVDGDLQIVTINVNNSIATAGSKTYNIAHDEILLVAANPENGTFWTQDANGPASSGFSSETLPGHDSNGDALTYSLVAGPAYGTLTLKAGGQFSYVPQPGRVGDFTFTYFVTDGIDGDGDGDPDGNVGEITIHVSNAKPSAQNQTYYAGTDYFTSDSIGGGQSAPAIVNAMESTAGVLKNAYDSDNTPNQLIASVVSGSEKYYDVDGDLLTDVSGTFQFESYGGFYFEAPAGASGRFEFKYYVSDGDSVSNEATVTIYFNNQRPVTTSNEFYANWGEALALTFDSGSAAGSGSSSTAVSLLWDDSDPEFDSLKVLDASSVKANYGTLNLNEDGTFSYQAPAKPGEGEDPIPSLITFTYTATDGFDHPSTSTATVTIHLVDDPLTVQEYNANEIFDMVTAKAEYEKKEVAYTQLRERNNGSEGDSGGSSSGSGSGNGDNLVTAREELEAKIILELYDAETESRTKRIEFAKELLDADYVFVQAAQAAEAKQDAAARLIERQHALGIMALNDVRLAGAYPIIAAQEASDAAAQAEYERQIAAADAGRNVAQDSAEAALNGAILTSEVTYHAAVETAIAAQVSASQAAADIYLDATQDAAIDRDDAIYAAETALDAAMLAAEAARATALAAAQSSFDLVGDSAVSDRDAAMQTAYDAYQSALASAADAYGLNPPDELATDPLSLSSDPAYQSAVTAASQSYYASVNQAETAYFTSTASARTVLENARVSAAEDFDTAVDSARTTYRQTLATAQSTFNSAMSIAMAALNSAVDFADQTLQSAKVAGDQAYAAAIQAANVAYDTAFQAAEATSATARQSAFDAYDQAVYQAESTYDGAVTTADSDQWDANAAALQQYYEAVDVANAAFDSTTLESEATFREEIAQALSLMQSNTQGAWSTFTTGEWNALKTRDAAYQTAADTAAETNWYAENTRAGARRQAAEKLADDSIAPQVDYSNAIFAANNVLLRSKLELDKLTRQQQYDSQAIQDYHFAQKIFLASQAQAQLELTSALNEKQLEMVTSVQDANQTFTAALGVSKKTMADAMAAADYAFATGAADRNAAYRNQLAQASNQMAIATYDSSSDNAVRLSDLTNVWSYALVDAQGDLTDTFAESSLAWQIAEADAQFDLASAYAQAGGDLTDSLTQAESDYRLDVAVAQSQWVSSEASARSTLVAGINAARSTYSSAIGDASADFDAATDAASAAYFSSVASATYAAQQASAAAMQQWINDLTAANLQFTTSETAAASTAQQAEATAHADWDSALQAARVATIAAWDNVQQTAWSAKTLSDASAQQDWVDASGQALADFVTAIAPAVAQLYADIDAADVDFSADVLAAWLVGNSANNTAWQTFFDQSLAAELTLLSALSQTTSAFLDTESAAANSRLLVQSAAIDLLQTQSLDAQDAWTASEIDAAQQLSDDFSAAQTTATIALAQLDQEYVTGENGSAALNFAYDVALTAAELEYVEEMAEADHAWAIDAWPDFAQYQADVGTYMMNAAIAIETAQQEFQKALAAIDKKFQLGVAESEVSYLANLAAAERYAQLQKAEVEFARKLKAAQEEIVRVSNLNVYSQEVVNVTPAKIGTATWAGWTINGIRNGTLLNMTINAVIDFQVGVYDALTWGVSSWLIDSLGLGYFVDTESYAYFGGMIAGTALQFALGFVSGGVCTSAGIYLLIRAYNAIDTAVSAVQLGYKLYNTPEQLNWGDYLGMASLAGMAMGRLARAIGGWGCFVAGTEVLVDGRSVGGSIDALAPADTAWWTDALIVTLVGIGVGGYVVGGYVVGKKSRRGTQPMTKAEARAALFAEMGADDASEEDLADLVASRGGLADHARGRDRCFASGDILDDLLARIVGPYRKPLAPSF